MVVIGNLLVLPDKIVVNNESGDNNLLELG